MSKIEYMFRQILDMKIELIRLLEMLQKWDFSYL
jgi:hypothetical protein